MAGRGLTCGAKTPGVYVAGDHHTWGVQKNERQHSDGSCVTYARARGYKWRNEYGRRGGFHEVQYGATVIFVIDPKAPPPTRWPAT